MLDPKNNLAPPSPFFSEQLTAFEVWLDFGGRKDECPMHLPILLQVLLSQTHRLRALLLLKKYLDLGPEAVNLSLLVGICPYISKLLQRPSADIRQVLVSIWSHVIGFDPQVRVDLIRDKGHGNFIQFLVSKDMPVGQRCKSAFILSELCADYQEGQQACYQQGLYRACLSVLSPPQSMTATAPLKRSVCLCIFKLLEGFTLAKYQCLTESVEMGYMQLYPLMTDGDYVVRAAVVLALGELFGASNYSPSASSPLSPTPADPSKPNYPNYAINMQSSIGASSSRDSDVRRRNLEVRQHELQLALQVLETCADGSALVRKEAVIALSKFIELPAHIECILVVARGLSNMQASQSNNERSQFKSPWVVSTTASQALVAQAQAYLEQSQEDFSKINDSGADVPSVEAIMATAYVRIWLALREVKFKDPHTSVAQAAACVVSRVVDLALATINFSLQGHMSDLSHHSMPISNVNDPAIIPTLPRQVSFSNDKAESNEVASLSRGLSAFASKADLRVDVSAPRESSTRSLAMYAGDLDTPAPLISHLHSWCRKLFLVPEPGFSSIEDPLSQEGKDSLFRGQLLMDALSEAKQAVSFFSVPIKNNDAEDEGTPEPLQSSRPKSPFELGRPKSPLDFPPQGRQLETAAGGEETSLPSEEKKFRVEQRAALNIDTNNLVSVVLFHAHLDLLAVADGNKVGIWSLQDFSLISSIDQSRLGASFGKISTVKSSRITSLSWVNQSSDSLLMAGSDDGALRVWRDGGDVAPVSSRENGAEPSNPSLVAAFHALPDIADTSSGSGMIITWQQSTGSLVSAGNSSTIRLWDMAREQCVRVFQTGLDTCTTSLCAQTVSGSQSSTFLSIPTSSYNVDFDPPPWAWIVAGFADGTISVYDERVAYYGGKVKTSRSIGLGSCRRI